MVVSEFPIYQDEKIKIKVAADTESARNNISKIPLPFNPIPVASYSHLITPILRSKGEN